MFLYMCLYVYVYIVYMWCVYKLCVWKLCVRIPTVYNVNCVYGSCVYYGEYAYPVEYATFYICTCSVYLINHINSCVCT